MRHQRHSEHLFSDFGGFISIFGDLDAAAFAAAAGVDLCFHDHTAADFLRCRFRFFYRVGDFTTRHRNLIFGKDGLPLILVNFHIGYGVGRRNDAQSKLLVYRGLNDEGRSQREKAGFYWFAR